MRIRIWIFTFSSFFENCSLCDPLRVSLLATTILVFRPCFQARQFQLSFTIPSSLQILATLDTLSLMTLLRLGLIFPSFLHLTPETLDLVIPDLKLIEITSGEFGAGIVEDHRHFTLSYTKEMFTVRTRATGDAHVVMLEMLDVIALIPQQATCMLVTKMPVAMGQCLQQFLVTGKEFRKLRLTGLLQQGW